MSHLSNETLYRLAGLAVWDMGFEAQDAENMRHMLSCDKCYRKLCAHMAMMEAVGDFGFTGAMPVQVQSTSSCSRAIARQKQWTARVEIGLTVKAYCAEIEVISASGGWSFARPAAKTAFGGAMALCPPTRLEDMSDCNTFVEVDPEDDRLVIRLSEAVAGQEPRAFLIMPDGEKRPVGLGGSRSGAKLPSLPEGQYRIILEK